MLRQDFDFESVHERIANGDYSHLEKTGFASAIEQVYDDLDTILRIAQFGPGSPHPIDLIGVQKFIARFAGSHGGPPGFIFTLNQDLFLERHHYNPVGTPRPVTPGVTPPSNVRWFSTEFRDAINNQNAALLRDPTETMDCVTADLQSARWCYLKLHGSYGWRRPDGKAPFVIGRNKLSTITSDPLLKIYFDIFEQVLRQENLRLLIIGYGFRDEHINMKIAEAIEAHGLEVYVVCPNEAAGFKEVLLKQNCGREIWKGVHGYFPYTLRQLFPEDQEEPLIAKRLRDCFFGRD